MGPPVLPSNTLGRNVLSVNTRNKYGTILDQFTKIVDHSGDRDYCIGARPIYHPIDIYVACCSVTLHLRPNVESFTCFTSCERLKHVIFTSY